MQAPPVQLRPAGKVRQLGPARFQPLLVHNKAPLPLGDAHASSEAAEAAYDVGKLLLVRQLQPGRPLEELKLHRPAAAYTSHPLWAQLTAPHCSFEEACSLLAGSLAGDFLLPAAAVQLREQQQRQRAAQRSRDSDVSGQQGAASGSVWEESGQGSDSEEEEEDAEEEESGRRAGHKRRRQGSQGSQEAQRVKGAEWGTKWEGLGPDGIVSGGQGITMRLARSEAHGTAHAAHILERYALAISGAGSAGQVPPTIALTTPDGRTHSCSLYRVGTSERWCLGRLQQLLAPLRPTAAGDQLRFTPTGGGTASVALVRGAPAAAAPAEAQQAAGGLEGRAGASAPGPAPAPAARAAAAALPLTAWRGLEPTDSRRYIKALPLSAVRSTGELSIPARYAIAAFGQAPVKDAKPLKVTATSAADGSTHRLLLYAPQDSPRLRCLASLMASLGAAVGDSLCLEPAGPLAVRASLIKAAAAAGTAQAQQQQQAQQQAQQQQAMQPPVGSHGARGAAAGSGGSAAASPPNLAADQLLAALETQGGVAPSQAAAYRRVFDALPSNSWRQAHLATLRSFVDSGDWQGAAAWMAQC